jgi:hypothetical protein
MTNNILESLIRLLQSAAEKNALSAVMRDVVLDNRGPPPTAALGTGGAAARVKCGPEIKDTVVNPVTNNTAAQGYGWAAEPQINDWRPPGINVIDAMVDRQDALDRADRVAEQAKLRGKVAT